MAASEEQSLSNFLETPVKLSTFTVTTATTGDFLTYSIPGAFNGFTPWTSKLQNIRFLRCGFEFIFQTNPQPFAKGRLWIYFVPFQSMRGTKAGTIGDANVFNYVGVELDVGGRSTPTLYIPYASPSMYFDLKQGNGLLGTLRYRVIDPLVGTATSEQFQLVTYVRMKDVHTTIRASVPSPIIGQGGDESAVSASSGVLSGTFKNVSNIANLWKPFPIIGPHAAKLGWLSDLAGKTAASFGFSKPQNLQTPMRTELTMGAGMTNTDSTDVGSVLLSLSCRNEIVVDPKIFSSSVDEMDFRFILSRPSMIRKFAWSTSDLGGAQLDAIPVHPSYHEATALATTSPTTLQGFIANIFQLWTGTLRYRISVPKNHYYSGRLEVSFFSGQNAPGSGVSSDPVPRWVLDLTLSSEMVIEIPYQSAYGWKQLYAGNPSFIGTTITLGTLVFRVANDLRTQDQQSQTLTVLVFMNGGEDLRFAYPDESTFLVAQGGDEPEGTIESTSDHNDQERALVPLPPAQRAYQITPSDANLEARTMGEALTSVRQLIKRFGYFGTTTSLSFSIDSRWFANAGTCYIDYFSWIYAFYSGSIRYKVLMTVPPRTAAGAYIPSVFLTVYLGRSISTNVQLNFNLIAIPSTPFVGPFHFVMTDKIPLLEFTVPFYHSSALALVTNDNQTLGEFAPYVTVTCSYPGQLGTDLPPSFTILKAAGDDFSFGGLIGPPRLTYA